MRHVDVEPVLRPVLPRVPRRAIRRDPDTTVERRRPHMVRTGRRTVPSPDHRGNGAYPVVRPDGGLLVLFSVYGSIDPAIDSIQLGRSLNSSATFEMSRHVASLFTEDIAGVRAPPFVSADVDAGGTVYATWADCRFSPECTANSIVLARSRDGVSWTHPRHVPFGPAETAVDRFVPALAVDPATRARGSLAVVAYSATQSHGLAYARSWTHTSFGRATGGRRGAPPSG